MNLNQDPKFTTIDQAREYVAGDRITCLVCGRAMQRLSYAHLSTHQLDGESYRERFGIPWTISLTSALSREKSAATIGPKQLEALNSNRTGRKPGAKQRHLCDAILNQCVETASRRFPLSCAGGCGKIMYVPAFSAIKQAYCDRCASVDLLKSRKKEMRRALNRLQNLIHTSQRAA